MSVFTTVTPEQLRPWLGAYPLGELLDLQGIAAGITNTNYFVMTSSGRYVLTLFEKHTAAELPYFLDLMAHLAERGIPCPHPVANQAGASLSELNGKPAALVTCLRGKDLDTPTAVHCAAVGHLLGAMHLAGLSFPAHMDNPRGEQWRAATASKVMNFLDEDDRALLKGELEFQAGIMTNGLPQGVIHADVFRDNVLFDGDAIGGLIDFYYACNDALLYDLAIAANEWCVDVDGNFDIPRLQGLLSAYHGTRPLGEDERMAWPGLLRIAALRFWLSRLYDMHFPQAGEITHAKDPQHFKKILSKRIKQQTQVWIDNDN